VARVQPKKLGRYELSAVLGKGAMGVVYEGRDPNLDRRVAIKTIMVDDLAPGAAAEYEARFRTEARSAARLQHPNIVTVYDSDRDGGTAFLVMEFIEGEDLKQRLDRAERFALPDALRLVLDLLAALDFAHRQGIVHRDVKPANLLIDPAGRVKLTDFGVARITGEATRTQGSMIGTLKYMAPEQVQGQKVDARADQFSAAVVAYQLFTGVRPFDGDNDFSIIHQIVGQDPPAPSSVAPGLPAGLDAVLAKAMAKQRDDRYATAGEFSAALEEVFAAAGVVPSQGVPRSLPPWAGETVMRPAVTVPGLRGTVPGTPATIPGAPITQELELEYWRAVRDSTDAHELEGFLARFPEGIYADLARRRLERLRAGPGSDPDRTVLQGMTRPSAAPAEPPAATPPAPAPMASAAPAPAPAASPVPPPAPPAPGAGTSRRWWPASVAAVLLGAVGVGYALRQGASAPDPGATASTSPAPAAVASTAAAPAASAASSAPVVAAAPAAQRPQPAASISRTPARRAAPASSAPAAQPAASAPQEPPATARREPATAASTVPTAATAAARLVPPSETCKDKMFLLKEHCLQTECARPGYQNFPACVRLREEARLREESERLRR